ncbi:coniferyl aldehyde dehydrogenase [Bradyrhizobium manausense]|uniref:coniferyl aldehyde dehydrogenase n=1 Tax=Bradyrhizobium manausense TaxID=989370 RepID=UPI002010CCF1|nr:coniferyl aldehyde dehydrogenase [Bradyrhizobium manausense]
MHIEDLGKVLANQRAAFNSDMYPSLAVRRERLDRIEKIIKERQNDLCAAVSADFGNRSSEETTLLEIVPLSGALRHTRSKLRKWMKPARRASSVEFLQLSNWVHYQPLGVVGVMVPWNYPLLLTFGPLIDVLAAGNRAMIKPSELLPQTSALLAKVIGEYFSTEEVTVIEGGVDVASAFSRLPFDHLVFTGSTTIGRKVMAASADNLTPLTLELGGKSPAIIAPDYDIVDAARDIAFGKLMNAGQTCIAPDYVLLKRESLDRFVEAFIRQTRQFYPKPTGQLHYSSLVGEQSRERLRKGLKQCQQRGVRTISVGITGEAGRSAFDPVLVLDPPSDCLLMEHEIFGPVLPVVPYDDLERALAFVRERPRPLALYLFTHDRSAQKRTLECTISGNVTINGTLLHMVQHDLPFGGVGPSGLGAYHGHDGFVRFSHARGIAKVRLFNPARLAMPPYGSIAALLARFMMR